MVRGLYAAASGMIARMSEQDVLASNLANVGAPGFRRDIPIAASFPDALALVGATGAPPLTPLPSGRGARGVGPRITGGARLELSVADLSQGPTHETNNPLDLALEGPGFFTVLSAQGYVYTRAGRFTLDPARVLVTSAGDPVVGWRGLIQLPQGDDIQVDRDGVLFVDGKAVDRLLIADPPGAALLPRCPAGFLSATRDPAPSTTAVVRQGYIEDSNVNVVREMAAMILTYRVYEANQRALQAQDQTLDKAINDIGRV
jgi:flagellar basal-body rod protein FlgF